MSKPDKYDKTYQFKEEVWGLISRHKIENDLRLQDIMIALELIKFELMIHAMEEAATETDTEGDYDGQ